MRREGLFSRSLLAQLTDTHSRGIFYYIYYTVDIYVSKYIHACTYIGQDEYVCAPIDSGPVAPYTRVYVCVYVCLWGSWEGSDHQAHRDRGNG